MALWPLFRYDSGMKSPATSAAILVINCGSSSLKFAFVDPATGERLEEGVAERLGSPEASLALRHPDSLEKETVALPGADHTTALAEAMQRSTTPSPKAIGHRVVHGGEKFTGSVLLTPEVLKVIDECSPLAPLHNPANLVGIRVATSLFPDLPQAAVFDTAFHQSLPPHAYLYAVPYAWYEEQKIRRYGFHGTSHQFVSREAARLLDRALAETNVITLHLGNGCSGCAVRGGRSVDTTMGLTPSEGLVMGTRSGDVDPALLQFLQDRSGLRLAEITRVLNSESGLLGLSGLSNDVRTLLEAAAGGHERARLALEVFAYRAAKSALALCAAVDRLDALVFTGGIGENAAPLRERILSHLGVLGLRVDPERNRRHGRESSGRITPADAPIPALVIPTNEEWMIAQETDLLLAEQTG